MTVNISFSFDHPGDAAAFLANLNDDRPNAGTVERSQIKEIKSTTAVEPPWEDAQPDSASEPDTSDPWASNAKPAAAKAQPAADTSKLFPANGAYEKESPNGNRTWTFGVAGAPDCDCGYPAAKVTGKGSNGKTFNRWSCPVAFGPSWKDKCDFSEFGK